MRVAKWDKKLSASMSEAEKETNYKSHAVDDRFWCETCGTNVLDCWKTPCHGILHRGDRVSVETKLNHKQKVENYNSHTFGKIDDCVRCLDCEIGVWNGWKRPC